MLPSFLPAAYQLAPCRPLQAGQQSPDGNFTAAQLMDQSGLATLMGGLPEVSGGAWRAGGLVADGRAGWAPGLRWCSLRFKPGLSSSPAHPAACTRLQGLLREIGGPPEPADFAIFVSPEYFVDQTKVGAGRVPAGVPCLLGCVCGGGGG
jgi:hypothetical protein